jgi:hypothetical protein
MILLPALCQVRGDGEGQAENECRGVQAWLE